MLHKRTPELVPGDVVRLYNLTEGSTLEHVVASTPAPSGLPFILSIQTTEGVTLSGGTFDKWEVVQ